MGLMRSGKKGGGMVEKPFCHLKPTADAYKNVNKVDIFKPQHYRKFHSLLVHSQKISPGLKMSPTTTNIIDRGAKYM